MSTIRVREAEPSDFERLRTSMEEILAETGGQKSGSFGKALWEWQYLGPERGSLIVVADDGRAVCGYYHAVLLDMRAGGGGHAVAAMVQDVATLRSHRGRGIFRDMGGFALERFRERHVDFVYTFPNERSLPSFVRDHGYAVAGRLPVYVRPLDVAALMEARLGAIGRAAGALVGRLHDLGRVRRTPLEPGDRIRKIDSPEADLEPITREFAARVLFALSRSRDYLGWRFFEKPTREYACWVLERNTEITAYLVTRRAELFGAPCLLLMDFGCREGADRALVRLVSSRVDAERAQGAALAVTIGVHPWLDSLRALGFTRVPARLEPRTVNLVVKELSEVGAKLRDPKSWLVTLADWDVL